MLRHILTLLALLPACDSVVALPEVAEGSTGGAPGPATSSTTTGVDDPVATTLPDPTTGPAPLTTGVTSDPGSSSDDGGESGGTTCGGSFICDPGETSSAIECSVFEQDCPPGEKCMPWANDGGNAWNALRCSPIDPDPDDVDEPCTAEGSGVSGIDSCVLGAMCWNVDPDTNMGICVPQCIGSLDAPECADPDRHCQISSDVILLLCLPNCDPLDPQACPQGQGCYDDGAQFICAPDASGDGGAAFEACEFINACGPGLACVDSSAIPACDQDASDCCAPFCDLAAPSCPETTSCTPYYEEGEAPPAYDNLGICLGA